MMWLTIGIVLGLGLAYLVSGSRSGKIRVRWYQWLLGLVAVVLLLLALQNYFALQNELEYRMANFALVAFGLPGILAAALAWAIPAVAGRRPTKTKAEGQVKVA